MGEQFIVINGFVQHHNGNCNPMEFCTIREPITTDRQFLSVKEGIINLLKVKDVFVFNIINLKKTMSNDEYMLLKANRIANEKEANPT